MRHQRERRLAGGAIPSRRGRALGVVLVTSAIGIVGCAAAAGAGVGAVAVGAAIATSQCYGYVDVLVMDGSTGNRACDADVSAVRGDEVVPFNSCFYAPLTEGRWRLNVTKPGYQSVTSDIVVETRDKCERVVHQVSIRLDSLTAPPPSLDQLPPPVPRPSQLPPAAPAMAPTTPTPAPTTPTPAPTTSPSAPSEPPPAGLHPSPVQPAPVQPAPVQPAPVQPAPVQPTPVPEAPSTGSFPGQ
jgi:hypothetical protein